jgi:alkylation response protein AidB-like acyl-CoA dehydrogenase
MMEVPMDLTLPREIVDLAVVARKTLARPMLELARGGAKEQAESVDLLVSLGLDDLDPTADAEQGLAAAVLAEEAGRVALPVPLAARVVGNVLALDGPAHAVGAPPTDGLVLDFARVFDAGYVLTQDGTAHGVTLAGDRGETRPLAPLAGRVAMTGSVAELGGRGRTGFAWHEVLSAAASLGALEAMIELARTHLNERHQFGKPLRARQALEHRFVDAYVEVSRLRELALFSTWQLSDGAADPLAVAYTLRLVHLEALLEVPRHVHQLHGAVGFCFEHDLAVLSRSVQYRRYEPTGSGETRRRLGAHLALIPSLADEASGSR